MDTSSLATMLRRPLSCAALCFSFAAVPAPAQTTSTTEAAASPASPRVSPTPTAENEESVVVLDPFVVTADEDAGGYRATSTLAGTRVRTDLRDVASSISVVTSEFLRDTGATNNLTLLTYTTNTEVGGIYGNYAGVGGTFIDGASEGNNFLKPNNNTRVRGLDSADNTRDYFLTDIPWDSYVVGRVDLQRGPNSILFGIGSPAGVINSSINRATYQTGGTIENRLGSFGTLRNSLDYNHVLVNDQLAVRVALLDDNTKYRQKPAFNHDQRYFGSLRWDPRLFDKSKSTTSIKIAYEHGEVQANRPRTLPPWDRLTPFFDATSPGDSAATPSPALNRQVFDPYFAWEAGLISYPRPVLPGQQKNFWIGQYMGPGIQVSQNPVFVYDNARATSPAYVRQATPTLYWGLGVGANGGISRDGSVQVFPFGSNIGINSFNEMAYNHWRAYGNTVYPGADKGFYKTKSLTDSSIFNFYDNLIDGPSKRETQDWDAVNVSLSQTFFDNRLGFELAYDRQTYDDGETRLLNDAFLSVDIRENLAVFPWSLPDRVMPNPYAGAAFTGGGSGSNRVNLTDRDAVRFTAFADVRFSDFMEDSLFTRILGRHLFTGLASRDEYSAESRNWVSHVVDDSYSEKIGMGGWDYGSNPGADNPTDAQDPTGYYGQGFWGDRSGGLNKGNVNADVITYLSGSLRNVADPRGLNLSRIMVLQSPAGSYNIPYFDSHWNSSVNPADPWTNPSVLPFPNSNNVTTQTENPDNYVGWVSAPFTVFNGRDPMDRNKNYRSSSRIQKKTESKGITWQGYLWEDTLVATVGYREDEQRQRSGSSSSQLEPGRVANINPPLDPLDPDTGVSKGDSTSWGLVLHTPRFLREKLPLRSNISLAYSDGQNTRVENRYGFSGVALPNAKGRTKDVSIMLSLLDDRLRFKVTRYETSVTDANLSSVTTEASTLGNNTFYLRNLEAWGTASALTALAGREVDNNGVSLFGGINWYWNWALVDGNTVPGAEGMPAAWNGAYNDPRGQAFLNHPSTAKQTAAVDSWLSQMMPQAWFDAYGFAVDVPKAAAGDWRTAVSGWNPNAGIGGIQPGGGGRINGTWPTGTANNKSEGYEFELVGQPTRNLNLSINASKQHASQTSLGAEFVDFITMQHEKYASPAGDLRLWWGGDATVREYYNNNIWAAFQFQQQTNGKLVPEMAPWRFNLVSNYTFDAGLLKGANIGLGYRWQDRRIIGYSLNDDPVNPNLDVDAPIWSSTEDWVDLWAGYNRAITEKINWRIQVNLRNVGSKSGLIPISVQPDGTPAAYRIEEGMTWTLTNTFTF